MKKKKKIKQTHTSKMRVNEENRRRNGHVLIWDQPDLTFDDKKSKSKNQKFSYHNFSSNQIKPKQKHKFIITKKKFK